MTEPHLPINNASSPSSLSTAEMKTQQGFGSLSRLSAEQFHCSCCWGKRQPPFLIGWDMVGGNFLHKIELCRICVSVKASPWEALGESLFLLSWVVQGKSPAKPHPPGGLPALGWLWAARHHSEKVRTSPVPRDGELPGQELVGYGCGSAGICSGVDIWRFPNHSLVVAPIKGPIWTSTPQPCSHHSSQRP